jgi:endogenous inhibitor of DNA gyrase (YacG/DUF329 family)
MHTLGLNKTTLMMMNKQDKISCPTCGKTNTWRTENAFKPFCSDRCKLIDLGEWASESRKLPGESINHDLFIEESDE